MSLEVRVLSREPVSLSCLPVVKRAHGNRDADVSIVANAGAAPVHDSQFERFIMPAEHMTPRGLAQGYFCYRCGGTINMVGSGHGEGKCEPNPEYVKKLMELNK